MRRGLRLEAVTSISRLIAPQPRWGQTRPDMPRDFWTRGSLLCLCPSEHLQSTSTGLTKHRQQLCQRNGTNMGASSQIKT